MAFRFFPFFITIAAATTFFFGPAEALAAFVCPVAAKSEADIKGMVNTAIPIEDPVADRPIVDAINRMKLAKTKNGNILDRLVGAYCPVVASRPNLTDAQRARLVRRFATEVTSLIYARRRSKPEDILLDVPLSPKLFDEVEARAKKAGVTQDNWLKHAIERSLSRR